MILWSSDSIFVQLHRKRENLGSDQDRSMLSLGRRYRAIGNFNSWGIFKFSYRAYMM